MTTQIHFLLREYLEGYVFNPHRPEGLSFNDPTSGMEIEVRAGGQKSDVGFGYSNLEFRAKISCDATERQIEFVESLINERVIVPDESSVALPYSLYQKEVVSSDGEIAKGYRPTSDFLPIDLQELCTSIGKELEKHAVRFIKLLRWLEKAEGPVKFRDGRDLLFGLYWKTTQEHYHCVPWPKQGPFSVMINDFGGLTWSNEDQEMFAQLWSTEIEHEPLGHQLLREAKDIAEHNDRSALLICYSALEVGVKQHISKSAPDAGWLAMYAPTPPLFKMLRDYLPEIHGDKPSFENWAAINPELKLITQFVEDRNRLAHRGERISGSLDDYLRITEDLLYAFDVFEGHNWAKTRVSRQFGELMRWKSTTDTISSTVRSSQQ
ncbi:MAG: hypothetical protein ABJN52_00665 [Litorimonas sp.]